MRLAEHEGCELRRYAGQIPAAVACSTRFYGSASSQSSSPVQGGSIAPSGGANISTMTIAIIGVVVVVVAMLFFRKRRS